MNSHQDKIYFDGQCSLCNRSINFVGKNDRHGKFIFTPFKPTGVEDGADREERIIHAPHTVVFETNGKKYEKSTAVLMILRKMGFPWNFLYVFIIIPRPIRDFVYDFVANRRKRYLD